MNAAEFRGFRSDEAIMHPEPHQVDSVRKDETRDRVLAHAMERAGSAAARERPVEGRRLNSGHYVAEEQPEEVLQEFLRPSPTKEYL